MLGRGNLVDVQLAFGPVCSERSHLAEFPTYRVRPRDREPLLQFIEDGLKTAGCSLIHRPSAHEAPFRFTFVTSEGERLGIVAYAFLANQEQVKNRPPDEHRFQIKYGGDLSGLHEVWQDPYGLYTTIFLGINTDRQFFVAADPVLYNPTRFSVSVEFKEAHAEAIERYGWHAWERERRGGAPHPSRKRSSGSEQDGAPLFEVLVGGRQDMLLRLIRFEREALGEPAGERHYLAEHFTDSTLLLSPQLLAPPPAIAKKRLHELAVEFDLAEARVLDLIAERRMLRMAVRGSVAEEHLVKTLATVDGVTHCARIEEEPGPDVAVTFMGRQLTVECKNSSRVLTADGLPKIDLQRTRTSKSDPCSRYYSPADFHLVAACIHAVTEKWEFRYAPTAILDPHHVCDGRLNNNVKLDDRWTGDAAAVLAQAVELL